MRSRATSSRSRATFSPSSSGLLMRSSLPPAHSTVALTTPEAPAPWGLTDTLDEAREGPQPGAGVRPGTQLARGFACQRRNVRTAVPSSRMTRSSAAAASTFLSLAARDAARRRRATWPERITGTRHAPRGRKSKKPPRKVSAKVIKPGTPHPVTPPRGTSLPGIRSRGSSQSGGKLIDCPTCLAKISKRAERCPKCGKTPFAECQICGSKIRIHSSVCPGCGDPDPFNP